jgi:endonuclease G, mitochondrial
MNKPVANTFDRARAESVAGFLRNLLASRPPVHSAAGAPEGALESFEFPADDRKQHYLESTGASAELVDAAVGGLDRALAGGVPEPHELGALEAIVLKDECPTLAIFNDDLAEAPRGRWARLENDRAWLGEVIRGACRVDCSSLPVPYAGSGLLVAPDLVMTNRHVARLFARGTGLGAALATTFCSFVDYRREKPAPTVSAPAKVSKVELIHPYWDVALLRVESLSGRQPLRLDATPLNGGQPQIAVIGYPYFRFIGSEYERDVLLDNFGDTPGYKRLQPGNLLSRLDYQPEGQLWPKVSAIAHNASTLGGNSGSLVVDLDSRRVVALHFAGQPYVTNWAVPISELARDPRLRDLGVVFEGAPAAADPVVEQVWAELGRAATVSVPSDLEASSAAVAAVAAPRLTTTDTDNGRTSSMSGVSITINVSGESIDSVVVRRGDGVANIGAAPSQGPVSLVRSVSGAQAEPAAVGGGLETTAVDQDWSTRAGYDRSFIGEEVPPPKLTQAQQDLTAVVPSAFRVNSSRFELAYHHYSVVFNRKRRMAWFSAANVDGDNRFKFQRGKDKWFIDPRIDDVDNPINQMGEELYATANTDRGHLTRYLDVAFGSNKSEALAATNDTFHFTNCSLQISGFNQGKDRWQGIERFILEEHARKEKRRMNVFTGPVFKHNDPVYQNEFMSYSVRIPLSFWKVCTIVREDGTLSATAFVLGQQDITELPGFEESLDVGATQVTLAQLEKITKLDFGALKNHDNLVAASGSGTAGALESIAVDGAHLPVRRLRSLSEIIV